MSSLSGLARAKVTQFCEAANAVATGGKQPSIKALLPPAILAMVAKEATQLFAVTETGACVSVDDIKAAASVEAEKGENNKKGSFVHPKICYEVVRVKNGSLLFHRNHNDRFLRSIAMVLFPQQFAAQTVTAPPSDEKSKPITAKRTKDDMDGFDFVAEHTMNAVKNLHKDFVMQTAAATDTSDGVLLNAMGLVVPSTHAMKATINEDAKSSLLATAVDGTIEQNVKIISWVEQRVHDNGCEKRSVGDSEVATASSPLLGAQENKKKSNVASVATDDGEMKPHERAIAEACARETFEKMLSPEGFLVAGENGAADISFNLRTISFYIKSTYPPESWYQAGTATPPEAEKNEFKTGHKGGLGGCDMGLLFNAMRHNPNAKAVHAGVRERAANLQASRNVFECMLVHPDGIVPEGSRSNIFIVKDNELHMSTDAAILVGVTRTAINKLCEDAGIPIIKRDVTLGDILAADAIVMSGTSVGVMPVRRVFLCGQEAAEQGPEAVAVLKNALASRGSGGIQAQDVDSEQGPLEFNSAGHPIVSQLIAAYNTSAYSL